VLYEASILVASLVGHADRSATDASARTRGTRHPAGDPAPPPNEAAEPTVQDIVDHQDKSLSD
jgi:hypothetical protein